MFECLFLASPTSFNLFVDNINKISRLRLKCKILTSPYNFKKNISKKHPKKLD